MKKIIPVFILLFIGSCEKEAELTTKQYPAILTHNVSNLSSDGVTLNGEFLNMGYTDIVVYGFVYGTGELKIENQDTVMIPSKAAAGMFSKSFQNGFAGNVRYNVKAFAKTENNTIYGNNVEFLSQGSKFSPWALVLQTSMEGWDWHKLHGTSNNELGFILFPSGDFYSYNPGTNEITRKQGLPIDGTSGHYFASFYLDHYLYVLSNNPKSKQVLRYDIESNYWTKMGNRPFCPNEDIGAFGFSIDHKGYFVTRDNFYSYNPSADTWTKKQDIPSEYIYSADVVGKKAYVFADNKEIWTYDPTDDSWRKETVYPGIWYGKIVSLTIQDKIYYGVSYHKNPLSGDAAQDFWEYSVSSKTWYSIEKFPVRHSQRAIFAFSLGEHGFIGANNSKCVYDLWKFSKE